MKMIENITNSQVHGRAAAANHAAVQTIHTSRIHFAWFKAAGIIVGTENR
jgi:hypothetical protein